MKKEKLLKKIDLYLEGELDRGEIKEIEKYLSSCPECMKEVEKYRKLLRLTRVFARLTPPPPPDLERKILYQISKIEKERHFAFSHFLASMATLAIILSIIYLPGMLNISGEINPKLTSQNSSFVSNTIQHRATNFTPPKSAIEIAKKQFDLYTAQFNPSKSRERVTYIIPITSSSSWQKVASYLRNFGNNYKVAIKPIIRDKNRNYSDLMAQLQRVKNYNPYVQIEDVSYNPGYSDRYSNGAGVILQISVER